MPVTIPAEIGVVARKFALLSTPEGQQRFLKGVAKGLRPELRKMYTDSADPFGSPWVRDKDGRPAYQSKKMGNAVEVAPVGGDLRVKYLVKWINAADRGHTFPARSVAAESQYLTFDKRGRLIKASRILGRGGKVRRGAYQRFAKAHAVGQRVLPERQQEPRGRMPNAWGEALNRGMQQGMELMFLSQATPGG